MNRRRFMEGGLVLISLATLPACWLSGGAYRDIENYIPLALLAFDRIIEILMEHNVEIGSGAIDKVKSSLADIQSAILIWKEAHGEGKLTAASVIRTALRLAAQNLNEFWERLQVPPQLSPVIKSLIDVILSTLSGYETRLPGAPAAAPPPRTITEFRRDFNGILQQAGEEKFAI